MKSARKALRQLKFWLSLFFLSGVATVASRLALDRMMGTRLPFADTFAAHPVLAVVFVVAAIVFGMSVIPTAVAWLRWRRVREDPYYLTLLFRHSDDAAAKTAILDKLNASLRAAPAFVQPPLVESRVDSGFDCLRLTLHDPEAVTAALFLSMQWSSTLRAHGLIAVFGGWGLKTAPGDIGRIAAAPLLAGQTLDIEFVSQVPNASLE